MMCIHNLYVYTAPSMYMDESLLWIEALPTEAVVRLNDVLCEYSMKTGFYPGKTEEKWWHMYVAIVDELRLRNDLWKQERFE